MTLSEKEQREQAMAEFLANGGKIQQIASGVSGRVEGAFVSPWGAPKKAGRPAATAIIEVDDSED